MLLCPARSLFPRQQDREAGGIDDFAGSLLLGGTGDSLLRLEIPEQVYLGLERPDMADIRIFDNEGLPVPFMIRPAADGLREKTITGTWGEDRRSVRYDSGGFYPIREIDFPLPRPDSIEALVKYRFGAEEEWRFAGRISLFRINGGPEGILSSEALAIEVSAPLWELEAAGDTVLSSLPACTIRWAVHELVFLGRGQGPWTLVWGNRDYGPQGGFPPELNVERVEPGQAHPLGLPGYRPRVPVKTPVFADRGSFILWGILILAVLILSGMALYIAKSMRKETS
jgi:hypothetical protein